MLPEKDSPRRKGPNISMQSAVKKICSKLWKPYRPMKLKPSPLRSCRWQACAITMFVLLLKIMSSHGWRTAGLRKAASTQCFHRMFAMISSRIPFRIYQKGSSNGNSIVDPDASHPHQCKWQDSQRINNGVSSLGNEMQCLFCRRRLQ